MEIINGSYQIVAVFFSDAVFEKVKKGRLPFFFKKIILLASKYPRTRGQGMHLSQVREIRCIVFTF